MSYFDEKKKKVNNKPKEKPSHLEHSDINKNNNYFERAEDRIKDVQPVDGDSDSE